MEPSPGGGVRVLFTLQATEATVPEEPPT
jgi:hypothetical protein